MKATKIIGDDSDKSKGPTDIRLDPIGIRSNTVNSTYVNDSRNMPRNASKGYKVDF